MVYARVSKGFKSGGFNGRANAANSTEYDPETVWSYEAGFKTPVANQLTLNGALFHNDYKEFQARISAGSAISACPTRTCRSSTPASCGSRCRARSGVDPGHRAAARCPGRLSRRGI